MIIIGGGEEFDEIDQTVPRSQSLMEPFVALSLGIGRFPVEDERVGAEGVHGGGVGMGEGVEQEARGLDCVCGGGRGNGGHGWEFVGVLLEERRLGCVVRVIE